LVLSQCPCPSREKEARWTICLACEERARQVIIEAQKPRQEPFCDESVRPRPVPLGQSYTEVTDHYGRTTPLTPTGESAEQEEGRVPVDAFQRMVEATQEAERKGEAPAFRTEIPVPLPRHAKPEDCTRCGEPRRRHVLIEGMFVCRDAFYTDEPNPTPRAKVVITVERGV
jgi:hypothetical protein